jgi:hypothetical protein
MGKRKNPLGIALEDSIGSMVVGVGVSYWNGTTTYISIPQTHRVHIENFDFFFLKKLAWVNFYQYMRKPSRREPRGSNLKLNRISRQTYA